MAESHVLFLADSVKRCVAATRQSVQLDLLGSAPPSPVGLRNARQVVVVQLVRFTVGVHMAISRRRSKQVFVGDRLVGRFDKFCGIPWSPEQSPFVVQGVWLKLSDGQEFYIFSHALSVITEWNKFERTDGSHGFFPTKEQVLKTAATLRVGLDLAPRLRLDRRLTWDVAGFVDVGQAVTVEFPFQPGIGDTISNGVLTFPAECPQPWQPEELIDPAVPRALWHDLLGQDGRRIPRVTKRRWSAFRAGMCGIFLKDFIPPVPAAEPPRRKTTLTNHQAEVGRVLAEAVRTRKRGVTDGAMFVGEGCTEVSFFEGQDNVMFAAHRDGKSLYFVEHAFPDHAVYVFRDEEKARQFGAGGITRSAAIEDGTERIIHAGAWRERISHLVQAL